MVFLNLNRKTDEPQLRDLRLSHVSTGVEQKACDLANRYTGKGTKDNEWVLNYRTDA